MSYKISLDSIQNFKTPEIITPFMPYTRVTSSYPKDIFEKEFSSVDLKKKPILFKFANVCQHNTLLFNNLDLRFLENFSLNKLINVFSLVGLRDFSTYNRFSPTELFKILELKNEEISFIKPFARQKNYQGVFNYSTENLLDINKESNINKSRYMDLMSARLKYEDAKMIVDNHDINTTDFKCAIRDLQERFAENIDNISINHLGDKYQIVLTTQTPFSVHRFNYSECKNGQNNSKKMTLERFNTLEYLNSQIDEVDSYNKMVNKYNFEVINNGKGKIREYSSGIKSGDIIKAWESGNLLKEDIMDLFTKNPACIPREDFKYFAQKKFKLTPFDTPKIIEGRYYTATTPKLDTASDYYKVKEGEILKKELQKLKDADSNKKIMIIDGLPGAGKSTIINNILKQTKEKFYVSDSDNIKKEFTEYYKDGIGAEVVHKASSYLYKNKLIPAILKQGKNLIYQTSGSYESLDKILKDANKLGYTIDFVNVNTDKVTCINRAKKRMETDGRFMDPCVIIDIAKKNSNAKGYMAEIISYSPYIHKSYKCHNYELLEVKQGEIKKSYNLNKPSWILRLRGLLNSLA